MVALQVPFKAQANDERNTISFKRVDCMKVFVIIIQCMLIALFAIIFGAVVGIIRSKIGGDWALPFVIGFFSWPFFHYIGRKLRSLMPRNASRWYESLCKNDQSNNLDKK